MEPIFLAYSNASRAVATALEHLSYVVTVLHFCCRELKRNWNWSDDFWRNRYSGRIFCHCHSRYLFSCYNRSLTVMVIIIDLFFLLWSHLIICFSFQIDISYGLEVNKNRKEPNFKLLLFFRGLLSCCNRSWTVMVIIIERCFFSVIIYFCFQSDTSYSLKVTANLKVTKNQHQVSEKVPHVTPLALPSRVHKSGGTRQTRAKLAPNRVRSGIRLVWKFSRFTELLLDMGLVRIIASSLSCLQTCLF